MNALLGYRLIPACDSFNSFSDWDKIKLLKHSSPTGVISSHFRQLVSLKFSMNQVLSHMETMRYMNVPMLLVLLFLLYQMFHL